MINGMTNLSVSRFVTIRKVRLVWAFAALGAIACALLVAGRAHAESLGFSLNGRTRGWGEFDGHLGPRAR